MDDIERIIEHILKSSRVRESAVFTSKSYGSQPIIQTGKQYRTSYDSQQHERSTRPEPSSTAQPARETPRTRPTGQPARETPRARPTAAYRPAPPAQDPYVIRRDPRPAYQDARPSVPEQPIYRDARPSVPEQPIYRDAPSSIPERYYQLRSFAQGQGSMGPTSYQGMLAYGSRSASRIFYEQARFMEDFEDEYDFVGTFFQYYPTYSSMSLTQLRGYFSWRTHVRKGDLRPAPASFAFLYVYELLCGIGTTPGPEGYRAIEEFRAAYMDAGGEATSSFVNYTRIWLRDYVVYHGLDTSLARSFSSELHLAVHTLLREEDAVLQAEGLGRRLAASSPLSGPRPSEEELFATLDTCASYHISGSRLRRDHLDELRSVCCAVFRALCIHCRRRRKTDYVEGIFGSPYVEFYAMFSSAVFYDPDPHPDARVELSPVESYICKDGSWRRQLLCDARGSSRELGNVLRAADQRLRDELDYAYPLKKRPVQAYVAKIIDRAVAETLERRRQEEARRITIDLTALAGIRAAAATTQEALLTDEERGVEPTPAILPDKLPGTTGRQGEAAGPQTESATSTRATAAGESASARARAMAQGAEAYPQGAQAAQQTQASLQEAQAMAHGAQAVAHGAQAAQLDRLTASHGAYAAQQAQAAPQGTQAAQAMAQGAQAAQLDRLAASHGAQAMAQQTQASPQGAQAPDGSPAAPDAPTRDAAAPAMPAGQDLGLSELELRVLAALLAGEPLTLATTDPPLTLVVDSINDKLFDLVGDAVIEFVSDDPTIIEEYQADVKEALGL